MPQVILHTKKIKNEISESYPSTDFFFLFQQIFNIFLLHFLFELLSFNPES